MTQNPFMRCCRTVRMLLAIMITSLVATSGIAEAAAIYTLDRFPFDLESVRVGRTGRLYENEYRAAGLTGYGTSEYHPATKSLKVTERGPIDFQIPAGTTMRVYAVKSGTAARDTNNCQVAVRTGNVTLYYIHLSDVQVKPGNPVTVGQYLGTAANTCGADGAHLHLAAWMGGKEMELRFSNVPATKSQISQHVCPAQLICPSRRGYAEFRYSGLQVEQPPTKPVHLSPANNSIIKSRQVTIKWADPPGHHVYQLRAMRGVWGIWMNEPANEEDFCSNGVCQVTLTGLVNGRYRWNVRIWNSVGEATSGEWYFTIAVGVTLTPTSTNTPTLTVTPTVSPTITITPSNAPTSTATPTQTAEPTFTPTPTVTPTVSPTITITPSNTPTSTATPTQTTEPTFTPTPTQRILPPNLITNPGFEQDKASWTFVGLCSQAIYTASSGWLPYDGAKFLAFAQSTDYPNCVSLRYDVSLNLTAGQQYTGAACLRGGHGSMPVDLAVWGVGGGNLSGNGIRLNITSEWQCVQHVITAQYSGHTILRLEVYPKAMNMDVHVDGAWLAIGAHQIYP